MGSKIRALAMDFDGVLTDGTVTIDADGRESVTCSRVDGHGLWMLREAGLAMCVITAQDPGHGRSIAAHRCAQLGIRCFDGVTDKLAVLDAWLADVGVSRAECAYAGDDLPDVPCMKVVGVAATPAVSRRRMCDSSVPRVLSFDTTAPAGNGFVRALCEWVLQENAKP